MRKVPRDGDPSIIELLDQFENHAGAGPSSKGAEIGQRRQEDRKKQRHCHAGRHLGTLQSRLAAADTRRIRPPPKRADPELQTSVYRAWRAEVLRRAGYRCQWLEGGQRCTRSAPETAIC